MSTLRRGRTREAGFTLLELLLALMILSLGAALAFPRISDAYRGLRTERLKQDVGKLVHEARRLARLEGTPVLLDWRPEQHSLILTRADRAVDEAVRIANPRNPWCEPDPRPAEIARLLGWDVSGGQKLVGPRGARKPIARLMVARGIEVHAPGFPILIDVRGHGGEARVRFLENGRTIAGLVVAAGVEGVRWEELEE